MKNLKTILMAILVAGIGLFHHSCSDNNEPIVDQVSSQVESQIQSKTWRITHFNDSGKDETAHFTGYSFTFEKEGKFIAENGSNRFEGTWQIMDDNSGDDSQDDLELIIYFNLTNDFEDLNEDWDFISSSATKIELTHISGGNGGTDMLTFVSNMRTF